MAIIDPKQIQLFVTSGDWAALYIDGKFEGQGHEHNMYERVLSVTGINVDYSDDFLRGDLSGNSVAQTVDEVEQYRLDKLNRHRLAQQKRLEAEELLREAARLENGR